jgi:hypothetical protein
MRFDHATTDCVRSTTDLAAAAVRLLQEDCFTLKLPELGPLTHLAIKSDGAGEGPAWHLDKVCIIPPPPAAAASSSGSHPSRLGAGAVTAGTSRQVSRTASFAAERDRASHTACSTPRGSNVSTQLQLLSAGSVGLGAAGLGAAAAAAAGAAGGFGHGGQPVWFVARRWLDAAHGLEVVLEAQGSDPAKSLVTYGVEVYTSDLK